MNKRNLSDRYTDLRIEKGLSQTELANALDCNKQYVSKIESGERALSLALLEKYADFFDVSTDYLLGRTDIKTNNIDVKSICEYTGFSEKSINTILAFKEIEKYTRNRDVPCKYTLLDTFNFIVEEIGNDDRIVFWLNEALEEDNKEVWWEDGSMSTHDMFNYKFPEAAKWLDGKMVLYDKSDNFNFIRERIEKLFSELAGNILERYNPTEWQIEWGLNNFHHNCNIFESLKREKAFSEYRERRKKTASTITEEDIKNFRLENEEYADESDAIIADFICDMLMEKEK